MRYPVSRNKSFAERLIYEIREYIQQAKLSREEAPVDALTPPTNRF